LQETQLPKKTQIEQEKKKPLGSFFSLGALGSFLLFFAPFLDSTAASASRLLLSATCVRFFFFFFFFFFFSKIFQTPKEDKLHTQLSQKHGIRCSDSASDIAKKTKKKKKNEKTKKVNKNERKNKIGFARRTEQMSGRRQHVIMTLFFAFFQFGRATQTREKKRAFCAKTANQQLSNRAPIFALVHHRRKHKQKKKKKKKKKKLNKETSNKQCNHQRFLPSLMTLLKL
jgi:hypothetical protein